MSTPHLCFVSQIGGHTGLARVADNLLARLQGQWRLTVISLNQPPDYVPPYHTIPGVFLGDRLGRLATRKLCQDDPPDVLCLYFDPGPVLQFLQGWEPPCPVVAYMPVDAANVRDADQLNRLAHGIFLTEFGLRQAREGGYTGPASVIGHGVDTDLYRPHDKAVARARLDLPKDSFLFGVVARNQPRKRWDLTLYAFREFLRLTQATDTLLYCHCAPQAEGWDIPQLALYLGITASIRFPLFAPERGAAYPEAVMPAVYSALDVLVTTSQGEGFYLPGLEAMACAVPQILPAFSALDEWPVEAAYMVEVSHPYVTTGCTNLVEWCVDYRAMAEAMRTLYESPAQRAAYAGLGYALAQRPQFRWDTIAAQFDAVLQEVASHAPVGGR